MDIPLLLALALAVGLAVVAVLALLALRGRELDGATPHRLTMLKERIQGLESQLREEIARNRQEIGGSLRDSRSEISQGLATLSESLGTRISEQTAQQTRELQTFGELLNGSSRNSDQRLEDLRETVERQLKELQSDNSEKLDQMRATVEEKLQSTLERRLSESFGQVSQRLEAVHKGLGEMQTLAAGVGDLKQVLTNVKTRGTWGEVQLESLLEQFLSPEQYQKNVATRPGSNERVEFAIRLPGPNGGHGSPVHLPIDAKFPIEDYKRIQEAQEQGDPTGLEEAARALEKRIDGEAAKIRAKYVAPPHTTDFAILFVPTESLYAEVLRRPGFLQELQARHRVVVAGPATISALLNSFQMGFRTLAIEQRSSEVWELLSIVKTEFGRFGEVLAKVKKKIAEAGTTIEKAEQRTRVMQRELLSVESLPGEARALPEPEPDESP